MDKGTSLSNIVFCLVVFNCSIKETPTLQNMLSSHEILSHTKHSKYRDTLFFEMQYVPELYSILNKTSSENYTFCLKQILQFTARFTNTVWAASSSLNCLVIGGLKVICKRKRLNVIITLLYSVCACV